MKHTIRTAPAVSLDEPNSREMLRPFAHDLRELFRMLAQCRPHGSSSEAQWLARWIDPLPGVYVDGFGNRIARVGFSRLMWASHTDTVHARPGWQSIAIDGDFVTLAPSSKSNCLGADDGAGCWLMRQMILRGVPGLYVFHRDEESGCNGSRWITENTPELVRGIDAVISLDRRGYGDVITHQSPGKTASRAFAESMVAQLPNGYAPDPTGVYTDSAMYCDLVPECTNLSVGYFGQHGSGERLDYVFLAELLEALTGLEASRLVIDRRAGDVGSPGERWGSYMGYGGWADGYEMDNLERLETGPGYVQRAGDPDLEGLASMVRDYPMAVAMLMTDYGLNENDLLEYVREHRLTGGY